MGYFYVSFYPCKSISQLSGLASRISSKKMSQEQIQKEIQDFGKN